ncbi:hypothetical protein B0H11DRAFT_2200628 [Mycena galericulata]|nr:hypothetical protein B0H11DRAFT_2200628 [Mycena galericulata]
MTSGGFEPPPASEFYSSNGNFQEAAACAEKSGNAFEICHGEESNLGILFGWAHGSRVRRPFLAHKYVEPSFLKVKVFRTATLLQRLTETIIRWNGNFQEAAACAGKSGNVFEICHGEESDLLQPRKVIELLWHGPRRPFLAQVYYRRRSISAPIRPEQTGFTPRDDKKSQEGSMRRQKLGTIGAWRSSMTALPRSRSFLRRARKRDTPTFEISSVEDMQEESNGLDDDDTTRMMKEAQMACPFRQPSDPAV